MPMLRRLFILPLVILPFVLGAARPSNTQEKVDSLVTHGTEQGQFLAVVEQVPKSDGTSLPVTVVWFRPLGGGHDSWREYARFDARVLALAERAGDLAVLLEVAASGPGRTQLRYVHNSMEPASRAVDVGGTSLPTGVTPLDIAGGSGGAPLLVLGVADGTTAAWKLTGTLWQPLADFPDDVQNAEASAIDLFSVGRRILLAAETQPRRVSVFEEAGGQWQPLGALPLAPEETGWMAINGPGEVPPTLYIHGESDRVVQVSGGEPGAQGPSRILAFDPPEAAEVVLSPKDSRTAAVALGSLRVLRGASKGEGEDIQSVLLEVALDPVSLERVGGEEAVVLSFGSFQAELREQLITLLLYALLVVAVVAVLRQRPLPPTDRLRSVAQQLAPLHIRFVAGCIDCLPLVVAVAAWWLAGDRLGSAGQWMLSIGALLVYFGHVAAAEAATGRTLGKMIFGLQVVRSDGTEAGPGAILLRNILRPLDVPTGGLGLAWLNPLRQRLGDIAAGTVVIRRRPLAKPANAPGREP